ncbi:MAG: 7-carboxy-7-deazaguanine synthase QueE [bacterium]|nr:7-carboxy-7-deazaguanine synthase QueE [bacterium]
MTVDTAPGAHASRESRYAINEIFESVIGEGPFTGHQALFIRFQGCNLNCDFCDTAHAQPKAKVGSHARSPEWRLRSLSYLINRVRESKADRVVFTGGEPMGQLAMGNIIPSLGQVNESEQLLRSIKSLGRVLHLETNGTTTDSVMDLFDVVTISPKKGHPVKLIGHVVEIRTLIETGEDTWHPVPGLGADFYTLSPVWDTEKNEPYYPALRRCLWLLENPPRGVTFSLSVQLHKLLNLP